jgi:Phage Tail Collar Domain
MAYIGNAKTPLLLSSNVRDDLAGGYNSGTTSGPFNKTIFNLTQEVPGGDEKNVTVVRRKLLSEVIVERTDLIHVQDNGDGTVTLYSTDNFVAAALNVIQPATANYEGDFIKLEGYIQNVDQTYSLDPFTPPTIKSVESASYTRDQITLTLVTPTSAADSTLSLSGNIKISRLYYGAWEILDITDYKIEGDYGTPEYNKKIRLNDAPQEFDILYVLHRGEATYNFVPSPGSVGVNQLSDNLRTFVCDRHEGNGVAATFVLSQPAVSAKSLLVTVDGIVKESHDALSNPEIEGEWKLNDIQNGIQTITFGSTSTASGAAVTTPAPPSSGAKIRILHLGFTSGNRRAIFVPGQLPQVPTDKSIDSSKLADAGVEERNIAIDAVTNSKIKDDEINQSKILLGANEGIRLKYADGSTAKILGVSSNTTTELTTKNDVKITFPTASLTFAATEVSPSAGATISLGNASNRFQNLHLSGTATIGGNVTIVGNINTQNSTVSGNQTVTNDLSVSGNTYVTQDLSVSGNISLQPLRTVDGVDISALANQVTQIQTLLNNIMPIGTIIAWPANTLPSDGNWLFCDGSNYATTDYPTLATLLSGIFDTPGLASGRFCVPDLARRSVIGKHTTDTLGTSEGLAVGARSKSHTHTATSHTHDLGNHVHKVPAHYHSHIVNVSTLAIASSGDHTTSLNHTHADVTSGASGMLEHSHTLTHSHSGNTDITILPHTHSTSTDGSGHKIITTGQAVGNSSTAHTHDLSHTHTISTHDHDIGYVNQTVVTDVPGATTTTATIKVLDASSATKISTSSVPLTTGSPNTTQTGTQSIVLDHYHTAEVGSSDTAANHAHSFTIASQGDATGAPRTGSGVENALSHTHNVPGPVFSGSSTSLGSHTHAASFFSGKIGDPTKFNGDSETGFNSDTPSINLSGVPIYPTVGGVVADQTGSATAPHIVLNFIIKAKNSV